MPTATKHEVDEIIRQMESALYAPVDEPDWIPLFQHNRPLPDYVPKERDSACNIRGIVLTVIIETGLLGLLFLCYHYASQIDVWRLW